ncbi:DUF4145 domain-containing protein [Pseudomonas wadenswilerensis]
MPEKYVAPFFRGNSFTCIHPDCATITTMAWAHFSGALRGRYTEFPMWVCSCDHCGQSSFWGAIDQDTAYAERGFVVYPAVIGAPHAHESLPEECRRDFEEARSICSNSPRGAAAILRLCLQKLLKHLGGTGEHIDSDIKLLVSQGLDSHIQQALDVIRVTGNNAVHPLEMNLEDDEDSVLVLFEMINFIVEERISRPQKTQHRFANLPEKARLAIEKRDRPKD